MSHAIGTSKKGGGGNKGNEETEEQSSGELFKIYQQKIARDVINKIGYTKSEYMFDGSSCGVLSGRNDEPWL